MTEEEKVFFKAVINNDKKVVLDFCKKAKDITVNINIKDDQELSAIEHALLKINIDDTNCPNFAIAKILQKNGAVLPKMMLSLERRDISEYQVHMAQHSFEDRLKSLAKIQFKEKQGLEAAIKDKIFPAIVSINLKNSGKWGTGFFYHPDWLVSNAHVIPIVQDLENENSSVQAYSSEQKQSLVAQSSYHRPNDFTAPDITIINTSSNHHGNCLSTNALSKDEVYNESFLFYVEPNLNSHKGYQIKYLRQIYHNKTYPIIYQCIDGSIPQNGSSGSPVIEAQVTIAKKPQWQFKVAGIMYARCNSTNIEKNTAYVVPIKEDFLQILSHLLKNEAAVRQQMLAAAATVCAADTAKQYANESLQLTQRAAFELKCYEKGMSSLDIALPDGLEKLYYDGIVTINKSLLIEENLKALKVSSNIKSKIPKVELNELQSDFTALINQIKTQGEEKLDLKCGDSFFTSAGEHFRVDVSGGGKKSSSWMLQIQDNTGKYNGKPLRHDGQPLSSIFAIVNVPFGQTISGIELAALFETSQNTQKATSKEPSNVASNRSFFSKTNRSAKLKEKNKNYSQEDFDKNYQTAKKIIQQAKPKYSNDNVILTLENADLAKQLTDLLGKISISCHRENDFDIIINSLDYDDLTKDDYTKVDSPSY